MKQKILGNHTITDDIPDGNDTRSDEPTNVFHEMSKISDHIDLPIQGLRYCDHLSGGKLYIKGLFQLWTTDVQFVYIGVYQGVSGYRMW